jgi:hypothetical protein
LNLCVVERFLQGKQSDGDTSLGDDGCGVVRREILEQWAGPEGLGQLASVESGAVATQSGDASQFFPEVDVVGPKDGGRNLAMQQGLPCG